MRILLANAATIGHRVGAGRERVPHRDERFAVPAGDRGVGDLEGVGLDAAAVVLVDRRLGDLGGGVGDELLAGGGEFGEVVGERRRDRAERARA